MLTTQKLLESSKDELVISFDLEWTKNYRITNGNKPFCFSFVYFVPPVDLPTVEEDLEFGFISEYVEDESEIPFLVEDADKILGDFMQYELMVVGHQLSSDVGVLIKRGSRSRNFRTLRQAWRNRKEAGIGNSLTVFDTRYDLDSFLEGKSRRLVDVCAECNLDVTQPEIKSSMTKMQRDFYSTSNMEIVEKLSVLNLRHSLSAALVYFYFVDDHKPTNSVNVNQIIHNNLKYHFSYVQSEKFRELISEE